MRDLKNQSLGAKERKKARNKGQLPAVAILKITARDEDGSFIAQPLEWEDGPKPKIEILPFHRTKGINVGVGDHILVKIFRNKVPQSLPYTGKIIRKIDVSPKSTFGIVRKLENGQWRLDSVERKTTN